MSFSSLSCQQAGDGDYRHPLPRSCTADAMENPLSMAEQHASILRTATKRMTFWGLAVHTSVNGDVTREEGVVFRHSYHRLPCPYGIHCQKRV